MMDDHLKSVSDLTSFAETAASQPPSPHRYIQKARDREVPVKVSYVSAPCGSGKTQGLVSHIAQQAACATYEKSCKILYIAPSQLLLDQMEKDLAAKGVGNVTVIDSNRVVGEGVVRSVMRYDLPLKISSR